MPLIAQTRSSELNCQSYADLQKAVSQPSNLKSKNKTEQKEKIPKIFEIDSTAQLELVEYWVCKNPNLS